ncbi:MAG: B12-binding domain-containing protein [Acidimicrobiales bacterium]
MIKAADHPPPSESTSTLTEAADHLGVHYMTVYKYVRTGRLAATKVGGGWVVDNRDLDAFVASSSNDAQASGPTHRHVDWSARLGDRLVVGDEAGAWSVIEASMASGVTPTEIYLEVLAPALAAIGAGWAIGEVTIAEEHRATTVTNRLIGRLGPRFNRAGRTRGTIVIGAVAGDHHAVPIAMAADLIRGQGFSVMDLGADSPPQSFVDAAQLADRLVAVGISSTKGGIDDAVIATADAVRQLVGCPIVIGGNGIGEKARTAHADAITTSADAMLEAFNSIASLKSSATS